ncbi:DUF1304 domain-containing protein [Levilactobacillus yonginensis]|uniref:DUF1304 domain-containing protein n=1 Tax=Levilactobacillus yonginensis TaxID=1054041 RepID=UPI000F7B401A|nr:DUF1304 domain-containing protein [Levilactobacillus yonginensis]
MILISTILINLIGLEHIFIMCLEIWGKPETQVKVFGMPLSFVKQAPAKAALGNMGIYNGMLGFLILASQRVLTTEPRLIISSLLMIFVVIVALFGAFTVKKDIFWLQGMPALLTFLVLLTLIF